LGEGHKGVQFRPAELGEVKLLRKPGFDWLLGVKPGEKLKKLLFLLNLLESFEFVEFFLKEWRDYISNKSGGRFSSSPAKRDCSDVFLLSLVI